jgi:hypothetical protein
MGQKKRGRQRTAREHGGRKRGDAAHTQVELEGIPDSPAEPTLADLVARSQALRQSAEALCLRMEDLAAQIDAVVIRCADQRPPLF